MFVDILTPDKDAVNVLVGIYTIQQQELAFQVVNAQQKVEKLTAMDMEHVFNMEEKPLVNVTLVLEMMV